MAKDDPYLLDFFQTITNVHFGGLAAEFTYDGKSRLTLGSGTPDFNKAVISFWFRIPQESIDAASAARTGDPTAMLSGIIPLVVMGKRGKGDDGTRTHDEQQLSGVQSGSHFVGLSFDQTVEVIGPCPAHGIGSFDCSVTNDLNLGATIESLGPFNSYETVSVTSAGNPGDPTNPTCIGVACGGGTPTLYVNFETGAKANVSAYAFNKSVSPGGATSVPISETIKQGTTVTTGCSAPFGLLVPFFDPITSGTLTTLTLPNGSSTGTPVVGFSDVSNLFLTGTAAITSNTGAIKISPDHWHHVLVSVNLNSIATHGGSGGGSTASFTDSSAKLYIALDDKNFTKDDLSSTWVDGGGPNDVITAGAFAVAGARDSRDDDGNSLGTSTYSLPAPAVNSGNHGLGIPATSSAPNYHVELAEFQMWTNQALDPAGESSRRAFITDDGKPETDDTVPEDLLGTPAIRLHGSSNWKNGKNTGTPPAQTVDELGASQNFSPSGKIRAYKPNPSLHGPQSPEDIKR